MHLSKRIRKVVIDLNDVHSNIPTDACFMTGAYLHPAPLLRLCLVQRTDITINDMRSRLSDNA